MHTQSKFKNTDPRKLRIQKWRWEEIVSKIASGDKSGKLFYLIGSRGSGKSTLMKDIVYHLRKSVDYAIAFSHTIDTCEMLKQFLPECNVYNEYREDIVQKAIKVMTAVQTKGKLRRLLIIMDDCMFDPKILNTKIMAELHMNGRHPNITLVNCCQFMMSVPLKLRGLIDYTFVLKTPRLSDQKRLHEYFFGMFEKRQDFTKVLEKCTNNYECLILDNTNPSTNLNDVLYYYKADPTIGSFRIGKKIFYELAHIYKKNGNHAEHDEENANEELNAIVEDVGNRNQPIDVVIKC